MNDTKIKRIVVEFDDDSKLSWTFDNATITEERGFSRDNWPKLGEPPQIYPSGHRRLTIKAWSGCPTYDSFRTDA